MNQAEATEFLLAYQLDAAFHTGLPRKIRGDEYDRHLSQSLGQGKLTPEEVEQARKVHDALGNETDIIRRQADFLISMLPPNRRMQLQPIPVGILPVFEVNAGTVRAPSGDAIIVVASGLSAILFEVAAWCAAASSIVGAPAEATHSEATRNIFQWLMFHLTRSKKWCPEGSFRSKFPARREMIGGLWVNSLNFVLGHEYGHAILGHLNHSSCTVRNISNNDGFPLMGYDFSYQMEFEADLQGVEIAVAFSKSNHNGWIGGGAAGAELALQVLRLMEELFPRPTEHSHPPASERLNRVHATLRAEYGNDVVDRLSDLTGYFDVTATIGRKILERLSKASR